jgi:hypothetical protein
MSTDARAFQIASKRERLADALNRVVRAGIDEKDAKQGICNAIADGTVEIRLTLREHITKHITAPNKVLTGGDVEIPPRLEPHQVDFENSRPLQPWAVKRESISYLAGYWHIDWIEVSRADITGLFILASSGEALPPPQWDDVAAPSGTQASLGGLDTRRAAGGQDLVATRSARRRGPKAKKLSQTIEAMRHDIQQGRRSVEQLRDIREKTLSEDYRVSRDTARKARSALLSEFNSRQTPTNDK